MNKSTERRAGKLVHPRLPEDLHEEVAAYATANGRSITNAVVYLVRKGLTVESDPGPRPTSWGEDADERWNVFRAAVQRGVSADEAADLAGIERPS